MEGGSDNLVVVGRLSFDQAANAGLGGPAPRLLQLPDDAATTQPSR